MSIFSRKKTVVTPNPRRQILNQNSGFLAKEAYKTLRTNLRYFLRGEGCKKICITSANAGEGKSITFMNLAISMAETEKRVLLIDADLRRPALARLLAEKASPGLANVLAGMNTLEESVHKNVYPNLDILFSGDIPPNPSELLSSEKMHQIIEELSEQYDFILVDTPPVNVVSDTCIVASYLDGVLLLVRQNRSTKDSVSRAVSSLQLTGARTLGFVLNGVPLAADKTYQGYRPYQP